MKCGRYTPASSNNIMELQLIPSRAASLTFQNLTSNRKSKTIKPEKSSSPYSNLFYTLSSKLLYSFE